MTTGVPPKLGSALAGCELHARTLASALDDLPVAWSAAEVGAVTDQARRTLDQVAYRFMKLQDSLGEKVLPGHLALALDPLPPDVPFARKLQRLEPLGAVPSAEGWRLLREVRNGLAHEYPEPPELQAASWTRLLAGARELLAVWAAAKVVIQRLVAGA